MSKNARPKFYVVWEGHTPGIYTTWAECEEQVKGYPGACYKAFRSMEEAKMVFAMDAGRPKRLSQALPSHNSDLPPDPPTYRHDTVLPLPPAVKARALAVDAACSGNPGQMEYRGIDLRTGQEIFHFGPVKGTNNIGEFLAIVHALALIQQKTLDYEAVYSDSRNAILWVKARKCRTRLQRDATTEKVFGLIERAERWLQQTPCSIPILKWHTGQWGEIPADFGRK